MDPTPNPKQTDPRDVMIARLEQANERAYKQFAPKVALVDQQLSDSADAAPHRPSDDTQIPSSTFRPTGERPLPGRPKRRGLFGFLLVACLGAIVWQLPYGEAAKQMITGRARQVIAISIRSLEKLEFPAQTNSAAVQVDRAKAPPPPPPRTSALAQTPPEEVAPATDAQVPKSEQLLRMMARDLATLRQEIERLQASQGQVARDNAKFADELKASKEQTEREIAEIARQLAASQEQLAHVMAKASKFNRRATTSAPLSQRQQRRN